MANNILKEEMGEQYGFCKLPDNIRQIGEQPEGGRIYLEDYVVTYMHRIFREKRGDSIVLFMGKKGKQEAAGHVFVYGALSWNADILQGRNALTEKDWKEIYETGSKFFPGAQICGWACSVNMWNSQTQNCVHMIQEKHFSMGRTVMFLEDAGEKEEKYFLCNEGNMERMSGYTIFYDKNPLMQEYMLAGKAKESFEATYEDKVTDTMRSVIKKKEAGRENKRALLYSAGVVLILLTAMGMSVLVQSSKKIDSLEQTIETLSGDTRNRAESATPQRDIAVQGRVTTKKNNMEKEIAGEITKKANTAKKQKIKEKKSDKKESEIKKEKKEVVSKKKVARKNSTKKTSVSVQKKVQNNRTNGIKEASYVVRQGDTLSQIVWRQYHTMKCVSMVKKANKIENGDKIKEGQRILLPAYVP